MKKYAKKHALIFIVIAFAITMIFWPLATKQSIYTAHENPENVQASFAISLTNILDYSDIANMLAKGQYEDIKGLIKELDLDSDDIPTDVKSIMQIYNNLLSDITTKLTNLNTILDEVELLINQSEFEETRLKLTDSSNLIMDIEGLLGDMDNAHQQIEDILGFYTPTNQVEVVNELKARLTEDAERSEVLKLVFEASISQKNPTGLTLEIPDQVYPGLPYIIRGQITYDNDPPIIERDIEVLWDDKKIYAYQGRNDFEIELTPDENTILGKHILKVIIEAKDQYSGTAYDKNITVTKELPEIKIDLLSYNILSRTVYVRGKVDSRTPLQEANMVIELKGISKKVEIKEGEFEASLGMPLGLINIGEQEIIIRFESSDIWQSSTEITTEIFVLDVFSLGFISTAFIAIGMIVYVTRRNSTGKGGSSFLEMPASLEPSPEIEYDNVSLQEFEGEGLKGTRAQLFISYTKAMRVVENFTGVFIRPCMTLREFLNQNTPRLSGAVEVFTELTQLAEGALYSPHIPRLEDVERAENLALTIKETLKS